MASVEQAGSSTDSSLIDGIADWLVAQALGDTEIETLFRGCCERLQARDQFEPNLFAAKDATAKRCSPCARP